MIRHRLIIAAMVAATAYGLIAFGSWSTTYLDTHASARAFVLTPAFTVSAIIGAIFVALCAFLALSLMLFPRPSGRGGAGGSRTVTSSSTPTLGDLLRIASMLAAGFVLGAAWALCGF